MNDTDEELKTIAILTMQSPLAPDHVEHWHRVAETLTLRLQHPVLYVPSSQAEGFSQAFERLMPSYSQQGYRRCVVMPIGQEPFDNAELFSMVVWLRTKDIGINLHIARCWSLRDVADAIGPPILETLRSENKSAVIVVAPHESGVRIGLEVSSLAFQLQQLDEKLHVHYAFLDRLNPNLREVLRRMDSIGVQSVSLITWRMGSEQAASAVHAFGLLHGLELSSGPFDYAWQWNRLSNDSPRPMRLLENSSWYHVAMEIYFDALSARSDERYFSTHSNGTHELESKWANGLAEIDRRVDSMLPSEYRSRLEKVSTKSMGSASLDSDDFGAVAWDEIWTRFCDLAMAGGPPHRGQLLEAITAEQAKDNLPTYELVVQEIQRGIEMVTGLSTTRGHTLGWVGVLCDDEVMAVWLMRAIIVENVMVRREGATLFLPAGPNFRVRKEIKNVITSVAKTVHYWRAHLRCR